MNLIDTHAHLYLPEFAEDIDAVKARARDIGVRQIYLPNIDDESLGDLKALVDTDPDFFRPMIGLHPTSVKADVEERYRRIFDVADLKEYDAIGEIGIDLYWDKTFLREQVDVFERQIQVAKDNELPIVIHARDSFAEIFEVVDRMNDDALSGIFHCFTGSGEDAEHIISYGGFKLGIGGVVTFKNGGLDKTLSGIGLEHLVLETDSPYLAPAPNRGKRNESAYLSYVVSKLSEVYGVGEQEIAEVTTANAFEIFGT